MAARDIKDKQSLERWLKGRPIEDARSIAARAALRAVPALKDAGMLLGDVAWASPLILGAFRRCAVAVSAAAYPARATILFAAADAAAKVKTDLAALGAVGAATAADNAAAHAAFAVTDASHAAYATLAGQNAVWDHSADLWESARHDALALETSVSPPGLITLPIWWVGAPSWAAEGWDSLKTELRARSIDLWDVWIDWYEARLRGGTGQEDEDVASILEVTEEEWSAGPAVANRKLKAIVTRFRGAPRLTTPAPPKSEDKAPAFISHATQSDAARAAALVRDLEAVGQPCWIAPRDIPTGADWNVSIVGAIDACDSMILLVSEAALKSRFVKAEVQHAFEKGKRVFPIRLADSAEPGQLDLRLKIVQHIDGRAGDRAVVASILKALS